MKEILDYLKEARTFYIATVEGDQPRVRPFGAVGEFAFWRAWTTSSVVVWPVFRDSSKSRSSCSVI